MDKKVNLLSALTLTAAGLCASTMAKADPMEVKNCAQGQLTLVMEGNEKLDYLKVKWGGAMWPPGSTMNDLSKQNPVQITSTAFKIKISPTNQAGYINVWWKHSDSPASRNKLFVPSPC